MFRVVKSELGGMIMNVYPICSEPGITWNLFCDEAISFAISGYSGPYVARVLNEVRNVFIEIFRQDTVNSHPILGVLPTVGFPQTERKNSIIFISSMGMRCNQHIYQFAHELCHFMIPENVCEKYRWFEETVCQMMSWYTMDKIYESRIKRPLQLPEFEVFYKQMPQYIKDDQRGRIIMNGKSLSIFIRENLQYLQKTYDDRPMNKAIAYDLYPLFLETPDLWKIVPILHTLTDNMSLPDAINSLFRSIDAEKSRCDQLIQRLTE